MCGPVRSWRSRVTTGVGSVSELSRMAVIDLMTPGRSDRLGSGGQVAAEVSGGS